MTEGVVTDIVEARTITEGALPRAWRDTVHSVPKPWFWFLTVVLAALGAVVSAPGWQRALIVFGLGVAPFILSLIFHFIVTPYRQRDEARRRAANLTKQLERPQRRNEIRTRLAELVADGDQVVNQLSMAKQMYEKQVANRAAIEYDRTVWRNVIAWQQQVADYIGTTPELGEAEAILFTTQSTDATDGKLTLPERFDDSVTIVRERQQRIRALLQELR
jgi:hypothetical protein